MKLSVHKIHWLLRGMISGGVREDHDLETRLRIMLINIVSLIGIFALVFFGVTVLSEGKFVLASFDLIIAAVLLVFQIHLRRTGTYNVAKYFLIGSIGALFIYLFVTGGVNNTGHLWAYLFPLFCSFLLGSRKGAIAIFAFLTFSLLLVITPLSLGSIVHFPDFIVRFLISLFILSLSSYFFEHFRERMQDKLRLNNAELGKQIKRLKEAEERVAERTRELQVINQRLMEEVHERRKTQVILMESEERYRGLVEQPFDGVYVHREGYIIYINKTGARFLGAENQEQILGRSILEFIHPDYQEFVTQRIQAISEGLKEVPLAEEKFIRVDGKEIDVEVAGTILMYEGLASVMVIFRDITQRKAAENRLRKLYSELELRVKERTADLEDTNFRLQREVAEREKAENELRHAKDLADTANRSKSDFLANMSHELRTPLNAIIGFSEVLADQESGELTPGQKEYLGDILQSSRHLLSLINDILDLAKVESGKMELDIQEVFLSPLLEGSLMMVKEKALKHGIEVSTHLEGVPEVIKADERKLKQVVYNLLSNAVKFTPNGGRVAIRGDSISWENGKWIGKDGEKDFLPKIENPQLEGKNTWVWIAVEDSGIGIRAEDLDRVFKPFEQVEGSVNRRFQGTGLGLSVTRRMVELHGGKIWAESPGLGKGSTFTFLIPI